MNAVLLKSNTRTPKPDSLLLALSIALAGLSASAAPPPPPPLPQGGTVVQGKATITTQGNELLIHQTTDRAQINWSSFNIGALYTTTFDQRSSSSVTWNWIDGAGGVSTIDGTLNAKGYVVLQNAAGFVVGGQAVITAHGLVLTTSGAPVPDLSGSGPWQFNALPPTASIINHGQLRQPDGDQGGSVYLIGADILNDGTISAPQGTIGLYAGQQVRLCPRPDGRGLSARVTLPPDSVDSEGKLKVDNEGKLIADAGTIAMRAQVVNQGGLVQANSVQNVNGVIELVASDSLNVGAGSVLSAAGDATSPVHSQGGFVVVNSDQAYTDTATSTVNVAGQAGGRDGVVEVVGTGVTKSSIQSQIDAQSAAAFQAAKGWLLINPQKLTLNLSQSPPRASQVTSANPTLNLNDLAQFSKVDLFAAEVTLSAAGSVGSLPNSADPNALFAVTSADSITFKAPLSAGNNWSLAFSAGPGNLATRPDAGTGGIYLNGDAYIQTQNGNISLWAANEVLVDSNPSLLSGIRTLNGGSIDVTTQFGDVNTGANPNGFTFGPHYNGDPQYYYVSTALGGISTAAGGDVTITAGGNVISFLPVKTDNTTPIYDGGTGAFGNKAGNVTITAGGTISGHFVLVNGTGTVTAGGNVGDPSTGVDFALSLVKGAWKVYAPHGSIFLQDVRNPNGTFNEFGNDSSQPWYHHFDYDPQASVLLDAGQEVEITGASALHTTGDGHVVPMLFPPSLRVVTGDSDPSQVPSGPFDFVLNSDVTLFPSPQGELSITTKRGGSFLSYVDPNAPNDITVHRLLMSDSAATQWLPEQAVDRFGPADHGPSAWELNNPNPVELVIAGNIENVNLQTTKATEISVGGEAKNFNFKGQNLHPGDITSINVAGKISYPSVYNFVDVGEHLTSPSSLLSTMWDALFSVLVDPKASLQLTDAERAMTPQQLTKYLFSQDAKVRLSLRPEGSALDAGYSAGNNPGFIYDPASGKLGYQYKMSQAVYDALNQRAANDPNTIALPILRLDSQGHVTVEQHTDGKYYLATTTTTFISATELGALYDKSQHAVPSSQDVPGGLQIAGPGQFNIHAGSLDLGSSQGILSWGVAAGYGAINEQLVPLTRSGAEVNLNVDGDVSLLTSTIASFYGGDVNLHSGGGLTLSVGDFSLIPVTATTAYGIFTSGKSDVNVTAEGDINIGGARIAAFNGGNVAIRSEHGSVNAGNGANSVLIVPVIRPDPATGALISDQMQNPRPFGSGIIAISPTGPYQAPGSSGLPGNITVETPNGNITSSLGGIQQYALNGNVAGGPTITLTAGTPPSDGVEGFKGNIDLGKGGVIGGTIKAKATGDVSGLFVGRQDVDINAAGSFNGSALAGGVANINVVGQLIGTVAGIGGVNASAGDLGPATLLGQNVSVGGQAAQSTLGTSAAATASGQAAAQQASSDSQQQLTSSGSPEDDQKKRQPNAKPPVLVKHVGRVTVLLPGS